MKTWEEAEELGWTYEEFQTWAQEDEFWREVFADAKAEALDCL